MLETKHKEINKLKEYKAIQKESWGLFAPLAMFTTLPAADLVKFSQIKVNQSVLDVGCGTGVVAITAARVGAHVSAVDLSPSLLTHAKENASIANVNVEFAEGDVESLRYSDNTFDVVLSQFGHMFALRHDVAINEMLRVLKPGGTIAFSTWPPDLCVGQLLNLVSQYSPPPEGADRPERWGDPAYVRQKLGHKVDNLIFDQGRMSLPTLSVKHYGKTIESTIGPVIKFVQDSKNNANSLKEFREAFETLISNYFSDNFIRQHFLKTKAKKIM